MFSTFLPSFSLSLFLSLPHSLRLPQEPMHREGRPPPTFRPAGILPHLGGGSPPGTPRREPPWPRGGAPPPRAAAAATGGSAERVPLGDVHGQPALAAAALPKPRRPVAMSAGGRRGETHVPGKGFWAKMHRSHNHKCTCHNYETAEQVLASLALPCIFKIHDTYSCPTVSTPCIMGPMTPTPY